MRKQTQRIIVICLAAALLLTILVPALSMVAKATVTQGDIQNIKDELSDIKQQKKEAEARLAAIRNDLSKAKDQMALIEANIALTESEISTSQMLLDRYDQQIAGKEQEILELEAQQVEQREEFYRQVRWMEETGSVSYLSILFQASSFSQLLEYAMLITDIMEYSDRIIKQLEATEAELDVAKAELQTSRNEQAEVQAGLEEQMRALETNRSSQYSLLQQIAASESEAAAEAKELADSEAKINKELKEAERKYAAQIAALNSQANMTSGNWYWPLPGRYKISSLFGGRIDPINGRPDNHTGTDIPAPGGTPIYAAQNGVVTTVNANRYASSYGYYCIINHGNGYATLYAHQNQVPIVKEGQTVQKGQVIGYVGTTGRSTGNHLHFELRVNGVRGDVLRLYPGMTFTSPKGGTIKGG
ncbi:MAG: peptidoglycan DD-metalloendopeptidase family protein [Oscillospiraceae bacterium]|jgi:murein DD-endopeptidase MepM/ murein hydrolase activator NlpD|nr:peptidoglycan DD-metalloendopeptidase family protein [Oscillospiraceae bacterium]